MKIPQIGRSYYVKEANAYVRFTRIIMTSRRANVRLDIYTDNEFTDKRYDMELEQQILDNLDRYTFVEVDTPAERKRRPFDYVTSIREALSFLVKSRYKKYVTIELKVPQKETRKWYGGTTQVYDVTHLYGYPVKSADDSKVCLTNNRHFVSINSEVEIDNIKSIEFGPYKMESHV